MIEIVSLQDLHETLLRWFRGSFSSQSVYSLVIPCNLDISILFQRSSTKGNFIYDINGVNFFPIKINRLESNEIKILEFCLHSFVVKTKKVATLSPHLCDLLRL